MATTLSNLNQARIEMAIQQALKNALVPLNAFSIGLSTDGMIKDDVIRVPVTVDPTAQNKTLGTATTDDGSITGVNVTLNTPKEAAFKLIEGQVSSSQLQPYAEGLAAGAVYSISKAVLDAAFALITAANYGDTAADKIIVAPGDFGQADLGELFKLAETKKLGRMRSLVLNAQYAGALIGESNLGLILATLGDQALKTAVLPPLLGMTSYMYSALPSNSENLWGAVIDKTSIGVAVSPIEQLVTAGEGDVMINTRVTEPESGITVNYKMVGNGDGGYVKGIVSVLYGVAKVQNAIIRGVSA